MNAPRTKAGQRLLERSAWDEGLRCHRSRYINPAGPEDLSIAVRDIEIETRAELAARIEARIAKMADQWGPSDQDGYIRKKEVLAAVREEAAT
jgi:hypothetical protein